MPRYRSVPPSPESPDGAVSHRAPPVFLPAQYGTRPLYTFAALSPWSSSHRRVALAVYESLPVSGLREPCQWHCVCPYIFATLIGRWSMPALPPPVISLPRPAPGLHPPHLIHIPAPALAPPPPRTYSPRRLVAVDPGKCAPGQSACQRCHTCPCVPGRHPARAGNPLSPRQNAASGGEYRHSCDAHPLR